MSVGPAALGNVLVQRLDAVLGTTMSAASANQVSGARPDAVSQPGSLEKPGRPMARRAIPARASRPAARAVNAPPSSTPRPPPRWPWPRAAVTSNDTTASAPTTLGRTARAILSLLAQYPDAAPPVQGARHCGPRCIGRPPARCHGRAARRGQPAPGGQPRRRTPIRPPDNRRPLRSAANVATVLNAIAGDPATAAGKTPGQTGATEGAPAQDPAAAARAALAAQGPAARALGQALREALQTSGLFYESHWPIWPSAAPTHPSCAKNRRPTSSRPTPSSSNTARPPRARAEAPASRGAGGADAPPPAAPMRPRPARRSTASTRPERAGAPAARCAGQPALAWRGEAWPGTPMDWEVQRDPYGGDPESAVPTWATRLKLDLPRLGLVDARLNRPATRSCCSWSRPTAPP